VAESLVRKRKRTRKGVQAKGRTAGGRGRLEEKGGGRSRGGNPGEVGLREGRKRKNVGERVLGSKKGGNPGNARGKGNGKNASTEGKKPNRRQTIIGPGVYHCLRCGGTTVVFGPSYIMGCKYCGSRRLWDSFLRPECRGVPFEKRIHIYYEKLRKRRLKKMMSKEKEKDQMSKEKDQKKNP
jgi:hypothetical protein